MNDWQLSIYIESMAITVEVEGMKAENKQCEAMKKSMAYVEDDFFKKAENLYVLARDARG